MRRRPAKRPVHRGSAGLLKHVLKPKFMKPGPRDLDAAMSDWKDVQREALRERVPGSLDCLDAVLRRGLVVTTHYSGTGAAEMALAQVAPGRVRFHAACDLDPRCREVLLHHPPDCAAEHVTEDLCAGPPKHVVDEMRAELRKYQDKLSAGTSTSSNARASTSGKAKSRGARKASGKVSASQARMAAVRDLGLEWVKVAMKILQQWRPTREDVAYCTRHERDCPAFPKRATSTSSRARPFHLEISGINCQPWTAAGQHWGWLDDRSIPCLILIRAVDEVQPDAVCIECTPAFDFSTLKTLWRKYRGSSAIMCPTDLGRPVARRRMYMWFDLLSGLHTVQAEVDTILDTSARSLLIGPEIFLAAEPSEIKRFQYALAMEASRSSDGPPKPVLPRLAGKQPPRHSIKLKDTLPAGIRKRYQDHREKVMSVCGAWTPGGSTPAKCYIVDMNRSLSWSGAPQCRRVPTLLRSSKLAAIFESEAEDRMFLPSELPAMHGIHLPPCVLSRLPARAVRSLLGNSMHVAQVGCFVQYALATRSYEVPCETAASMSAGEELD